MKCRMEIVRLGIIVRGGLKRRSRIVMLKVGAVIKAQFARSVQVLLRNALQVSIAMLTEWNQLIKNAPKATTV